MFRLRCAPGRASKRSWLRWSAGIAALALLAFGAAELLLRVFPQYLPVASQFRLHDNAIKANEVNSRPDPEFGYLWRPQISDRIEGFEFGFDYSTDSHGFRNPRPWPERADIVVIGDSQAFGFGVDDGDDWATELAARLPGLSIVNLGLIGAAPQQFEKIYRAYGRDLQPEVVLVALFPPHAVGMAELFDQWQAEGRPDRLDLRRLRSADHDTLLGRIKRGVKSSYAALGLWYGARAAFGASDLETMRFDEGPVRLVSTRYGDAAAGAARARADFTRVVDLLDRLDAVVRGDGAQMIVLPFPTKEEVHLPFLGEQPNRLTRPFERALEERGVASLDLLPALQEEVAAGRRLFFEIDLHPNPAGHEVIAQAASEALWRCFGSRALAALPAFLGRAAPQRQ